MNVHNIELEVREREFWYDTQIIFHTDPGDKKRDIIEYLYNEGFIQDRRTPYIIKELS